MKHIAILGSTGSIGTQALEVIRANPELFRVDVLSTNNRTDLLIQQAIEFQPEMVVVANKAKYPQVRDALKDYRIRVLSGQEGLNEAVSLPVTEIVLSALVGYAGLEPTIGAIKAGKNIALANKETMVTAGELVTRLARKQNVSILPVDSEHSAIFQCLIGEEENKAEKIILTASGGPFRNLPADKLHEVTLEDALQHPNWCMGAKITIDSASLMNKGLEIIEARWLFGLSPDQIEVVIHPQSIIHSMVQFRDGSIKAQMGLPDMRLPILFALGYPSRIPSDFPRLDFSKALALQFEPPDIQKFPCLQIAFDCMKAGGNMPCIMNAANEVAVEAFIERKIPFTKIPAIISRTLEKSEYIAAPDLDDYQRSDRLAREIARVFI
ncbi:MAG TPA: 1-deoxy-D-xylulose-5-phosphate reductoisomerase [Bacteroidales bacterium]|nr:1-deoxy-D-xylulose-5-phosphate reductoisomerase [Bacteroidales bacterium]HQK37142.1 1-deoxy-D-xylulose-5-phosphate reductoisomerase [Bacteroidales bacterium]